MRIRINLYQIILSFAAAWPGAGQRCPRAQERGACLLLLPRGWQGMAGDGRGWQLLQATDEGLLVSKRLAHPPFTLQ